ncbi:ArnT family glycosyltransferase [Anaerobacillus sp. MEB173]|uniref:ArnT family glycosyltransferase n=1 Tax=Anaerobacillus sp. MEB173 TaxID=3383345 RepID=UPI003F90F861
MKPLRSSEKVILIILLLFIFSLRLPYLSHSPFEIGESWRQSDTESMARNFVEDRFNILYPQLNYDGVPPNYAQLEFQITTFLIAILYKLFGFHYEIARLIPLLFFTGSAYFLFYIVKRFYSMNMAWITTLLYSIFPLNLYFSRAIMPEAAALFFFLGAFYFFCQWIIEEKNWAIIAAAFMTAIAISIKVPTIFAGIPMLIMSIMKYKQNVFRTWQLWIFAAISLLPPLIYFKWLESVAEFNFVSGIGTKHIIPKFTTALFTPEALDFFQTYLPKSFTLICLSLFLIGVFMTNWKVEYPIVLLLLAFILEMVTIVAVIQFNYYLVFISPVIAIFAAKPLAYCFRWVGGFVPFIMLMTIISIVSFSEVKPYFEEKAGLVKQAEVVKQYTEDDDLIVIGTFSPELLNASSRKGWRANINYYDYIPKGPEEELKYFVSHGARYFFPVKGYIYGDTDHSYRNYLEKHYKKINVIINDSDYSFFQLQ